MMCFNCSVSVLRLSGGKKGQEVASLWLALPAHCRYVSLDPIRELPRHWPRKGAQVGFRQRIPCMVLTTTQLETLGR